jgi:predicted nuclease with TOPRIM domain
MTEPLNHKLDISKIKTLTDVKNVFECMNLYASAEEDYEKYELLKEYFTIPNEPQEIKFELPRKSLEEIQQECEEKFDKHIESIKHKFAELKCHQEYYYNQKFDRIFEKFEYAKEHGQFPSKLTYSNLIATGSNITSTFVIKQGNKHEGYYTIGNGYLRFYMPDKPNFIVRFCMDKLLGFKWIDDK